MSFTQFVFTVCLDFIGKAKNETECINKGFVANSSTGACYNNGSTIKMIFNFTLAKKNGIERRLPSEEYFEYIIFVI